MDDPKHHNKPGINAGDLFSESTCLSLEALTKYLNGRISSEERLKIERHLVDCPLCSDAIEGFSSSGQPSRTNRRIEEINEEIQLLTQDKPGKIIIIGYKH